jgi:hypothetical protein
VVGVGGSFGAGPTRRVIYNNTKASIFGGRERFRWKHFVPHPGGEFPASVLERMLADA